MQQNLQLSSGNSSTEIFQHITWLLDWLSHGFTFHSTQNTSFQRRSPSQSLGLVLKN